MKNGENKKQRVKKVLALLMTMVMIFGTIPPVTYALPAGVVITDTGADPVTTAPTALANGQIWTDKSVIDNEDGTFDITLRAAGKDYKITQPPKKFDIILALDFSYSMSSDNKLSRMRSAAKTITEQLVGTTASTLTGNRLAIIKYNDMAQTNPTFSTNATTLKNSIDSGYGGTYTNIQNAFLNAQNAFNNRSDTSRTPILILISDGEPTVYHENLTSHTTSNDVVGQNDPFAVWWTIRQGIQLKNSVPGIQVYTIGFDVIGNADAEATLQPTETNTIPFRPFHQLGQKVTQSQTGATQYTAIRTQKNNGTWNNWQNWIATVPPVFNGTPTLTSNSVAFDDWSFTQYPPNVYNVPSENNNSTSGFTNMTSVLSPDGKTETRTGYKTKTVSSTIYNITSIKDPFAYAYWDGGYIIDNSQQALYDALNAISQGFINSKPMSHNEVDDYTNIVITDVIGNGFVRDGSLPAGLSQTGNTITWTIDGDAFTTMPPDSTTPPVVTSITFKVKIDELTNPGTYYTNSDAYATFDVDTVTNPYYIGEEDETIVVDLPNKGWVTLSTPNLDASLTVNKIVVGPVSNAQRNFSFSIYKTVSGGTPVFSPINISVTGAGTQSNTVTLSIPYSDFDSNGEAVYYIQENETAPNTNWIYATGRVKVIFKRDALVKSVDFRNTYAPEGKLNVYKAWDPTDAVKEDISFILQKEVSNDSNGTTWENVGEGAHVIPAGSTVPVTIGELEMGVKYRVQEVIPSLFDYEPSVNPETVTFDALTEFTEATITITNKYVPPVGKILIIKEWSDGDFNALYRPNKLKFNVVGPNVNQQIEMDALFHRVDSDTWAYEYLVTTAGTYTFTEVVPLDYQVDLMTKSATIDFSSLAGRSKEVTFTNDFVEPFGEITLTKEWINESPNGGSFRPTAIQFKLLKNGLEIPNYPLIGLPENDATPWSTKLTGLALDANYSVVEVLGDPEGDYSVSYSNPVYLSRYDDGFGPSLRIGGITVTNNFISPKGHIDVSKTWNERGINDSSAVRPSEIYVQLYKNGSAYGEPVVLTDAHDEDTFGLLPLDGSTYHVVEYALGDNIPKLSQYAQSVVYLGGGASTNGIVLNAANRSGTASLSNAYAKGTLSVYKNWIHLNDPDVARLTPVTIHLYQVKMVPEEPIITTPPVIAIEEDQSENPVVLDDPVVLDVPVEPVLLKEVTTLIDTRNIVDFSKPIIFYDLAISDEHNTSIRYYVIEEPVDFYTTSYGPDVILSEENKNGSLIVTNTYVDPRGKLTVEKVWDNGYNPNQPESVQIMLWQNDIPYLESPVTFSGTYVFDELPLGYTYRVTEVNVDPRYTPSYSGDTVYLPAKNFIEGNVPEAKVIITNTYVPQLSSIDFTKVWTGGQNTPIKVSLLRSIGGVPDIGFRMEKDLNSETGWTHTFSGLEIYGPGQLKYEYHAIESGAGLSLFTAVNNQTVFLNPETSSDLSIQNIYAPNKGTLVIQKVWYGPDEQVIEPPVDEVAVRLIVNGVPEVNTILLNEENGWKVTLTELDVNKTYKVEEVTRFEAFEVTYSNQSAIVFSAENLRAEIIITNTRSEDDVDFVVNKTVANALGELVNGVYTFNYTVELVNNGNRTLNTLFIEDKMVAPVGATLVYSPTPSGTIEGGVYYNLEGSLAPMTSRLFNYSVTVNLAGTYNNVATGHAFYVQTEYTDSGAAIAVATSPIPNPTDPDPIPVPDPDPDPLGLVTVSFVDEQGNTVSPSYQLLGDYDENYVTVPRTIDGYELVVTPANASGIFTVAPITVVYVYGIPDVIVDEEETPLGETTTEPEIIIDVPEEDTPLADALPDTGQLPTELFYGIGSFISAVGVWMKRRK